MLYSSPSSRPSPPERVGRISWSIKLDEHDLKQGRLQGPLVDRHNDLSLDDFEGDPCKGVIR